MEPLELLQEDGHSLFKTAREMAKDMPTVFSSYAPFDHSCVSNPPCLHCRWRFAARLDPNFRKVKTKEEVVAKAVESEKAGADWLFLPSGCKGAEVPEYFYEYVRAVRQNSGIELYGLFGTTGKKSLARLKEAGLDGFRCGLESPSESVLKRVRPYDNLKTRLQTIRDAKELGLKVWSGFIIGLGESAADIARGIKTLKELEVDSVTLGWFEPIPFTEMEQDSPPNPFWAAKVTAATRIYLGKIDMLAPYHNNNPDWGFRAGCNGTDADADARVLDKLRKMRATINAIEAG